MPVTDIPRIDTSGTLSGLDEEEHEMVAKKEICTCTNCGNEAETIVTCELVDVEESPGKIVKKQHETRKCTVCGNEADMIIDMEG